MKFEYVWGLLEIKGCPPASEKFVSLKNGYKFYPFLHDGVIHTFDYVVWDTQPIERDACLTDWPAPNQIREYIKKAYYIDFSYMIAFSNQPLAQTIDPDNSVSLSQIPSDCYEVFSKNFSVIGYDVIDKDGTSSLVNVGYTPEDLDIIKNLSIMVNEFGLIETYDKSKEFAELSSCIAREHAPFFPVEIWKYNNSAE